MSNTPAAPQETEVKVWDGWIRLWHWSIVLLIPVAYLTGRAGRMDWHFWSGYALLTLVAFRILWGLVGSEPARFARFLSTPAAAWRHLRKMGAEMGPDRELTHNPAGAWMVALLVPLLLAQAVSGLFVYDQIFTYGPLARQVDAQVQDWAGWVHYRAIYVVFVLIVLHIMAIAWYRLFPRHDLVRAMMLGHKPMPAGTRPPRMAPRALGVVVLALCAAVVLYIRSFGDY